MSRQLVACLLNVSEGRRLSVVEKIAEAALRAVNPPALPPSHPDWLINATVLNIFQDVDYHRSVLTIVSSEDKIGVCVEAGCRAAYELIDLSKHEGVHPRLGAVDLVPLHPISENMSLESLGHTAAELGHKLTTSIPGTSVFFFGKADAAGGRGLVQRRKEVGWFRRPVVHHALRHDLGSTPTPKHGLTGVGAIPYMLNVNLTLDTKDLTLGRRVAAALRASSPGGLPGVQAMAFPHQGRVEVACNVDLLPRASLSATTLHEHVMESCLGDEYLHTPAREIERRVDRESGGVPTVGTTLVGFTPDQARTLALKALTSGQDSVWKTVTARRM